MLGFNIFLVTLLLIASQLAPIAEAGLLKFLFGSSNEPYRNNFQVTFGLNPFKSFTNLPRKISEATNWNNISGNDCKNGGLFNGFRYIYQDDPSLSLLFDVNGIIAGIQMNSLRSDMDIPANSYKFNSISMFSTNKINGVDYYTTTAYFVDPESICTSGRTENDLNADGTATSLFFQNGNSPSSLINVPLKRAGAISEGWTKNNCFAGMGYHNFYKSEEFQATNCTQIRPAFLLYNAKEDGDLHGFGLTAVGHANSKNSRFEYPPSSAIKMIVGSDVAKCLTDQADTIGLTTMHVYFTNNNLIKHLCPIF